MATVNHYIESIPALGIAIRELDSLGNGQQFQAQPFTANDLEIRSAPSRSEIDSQGWLLFLDRYKRSLIRLGFATELAKALSGAFHEMVDNIVQHSGIDPDHPAKGIVGFTNRQNQMSFGVADLGCGVLTSLRRNPIWVSMTASHEALLKIVCDGASSRGTESGGGFKQLHSSLIGYNGVLSFRSGNGALTVDGRLGSVTARPKTVTPLDGFQLSVTCSLNLAPTEMLISIT